MITHSARLSCREYLSRTLILLLLAVPAFTSGCTTTRQQTAVAGEVNELRTWDDHEVIWVETTSGERVDFVEGSGRIEGTRNRETRRVDYVVIGTDAAGVERRIELIDLALVNTSTVEDSSWKTAGLIVLSVATAAGAILLATGSL